MSGNYFSTIEKRKKTTLTNISIGQVWFLSEERCAWGNCISYTPRVHYVSQAAAIGDAERKRDAGASWTIWAAAVLVAEFQSMKVPEKKLYLIARPTNDIHYLWPLELKILDGKLIKPKTYYFEEESVKLSNCSYEELLSFLSNILPEDNTFFSKETPFLIGEEYSALEDSLSCDLFIKSTSHGGDYRLGWYRNNDRLRTPNPLANLMFFNKNLQEAIKVP